MPNLSALVVDDSKVGRLTMMKKLEALGIQVRVAESGQEALDCLEQARPDVIFMDHMMPDMDGFETTRRIKASPASRHIPVIVISGNEGPEFLRQAREAGAQDAIVKPPATEILEQLIAALPTASAPPPDGKSLERLRDELLAEMDRRRAGDAEVLADLGRRLKDLESRSHSYDQRLLDLETGAERRVADLEALRAELNEHQALVADHASLAAARNSSLDLRLTVINQELTRLTQDLNAHGAALSSFQVAAPREEDGTAAAIEELRTELRHQGERWSEPKLREVVVDTLKHLKSAKQAQVARDTQESREAEPPSTPPRRGAQIVLLAGAALLSVAGLALYLFLAH